MRASPLSLSEANLAKVLPVNPLSWLCRGIGFAVLALFAAFQVLAADPGTGRLAPVVIKQARISYTVGEDGLYTQTVHFEILPTNDSAAGQVAQQRIPYSADLSDVQITEAYTLKSDGRKLQVNTSQMFDQLGPRGSLCGASARKGDKQ